MKVMEMVKRKTKKGGKWWRTKIVKIKRKKKAEPAMWVEIICGLVIYRLFRRVFYDDHHHDVLTSDSIALFSIATREAVVICVQNCSGIVSINADGSWVSTGGNSHKTEQYPDPVAEAKRQVSILESYLEQRGATLPKGYLSCRVICPNPNFRAIHSDYFPSEVVTYEQWEQLKPEPKSMFSGWIKDAFRGGKKEMQEPTHKKLNFILTTAPTWDRLELKGNKYLLGEFMEFKGKQDDTQLLRNVKRSKVSRLIIQKTSMFGLAHSKLQVLYSPWDYRNEGASASEWKEATVRSSTEVLFQPQNLTKVCKFKLSSIVSMSLSA
ncbi:hypothetical protein HYC85_031643 [Camellia sinensis]|uniref:NERD domain-containing protein n=1 Tax=Camellia sinensis TaxID=4442 RepID=A0A7J7FR26_CAMSI|nr:hypothetical protein HYC85_031643 [Camellia sinensis]